MENVVSPVTPAQRGWEALMRGIGIASTYMARRGPEVRHFITLGFKRDLDGCNHYFVYDSRYKPYEDY